eukprot:scaffold325848_cov61-Tisochrysis_lutea.AAC.5
MLPCCAAVIKSLPLRDALRPHAARQHARCLATVSLENMDAVARLQTPNVHAAGTRPLADPLICSRR